MRIKRHKKFVYYINALREDKVLPPKSKDHALCGNYKDCREFHLGGDMLIIYLESNFNEIILMRLGTHSQLFK